METPEAGAGWRKTVKSGRLDPKPHLRAPLPLFIVLRALEYLGTLL